MKLWMKTSFDVGQRLSVIFTLENADEVLQAKAAIDAVRLRGSFPSRSNYALRAMGKALGIDTQLCPDEKWPNISTALLPYLEDAVFRYYEEELKK